MPATSTLRAGRCATTDIDLEALAEAYTLRPASGAALRRAADAAAHLGPGAVAIDVGGGPGEAASRWAERGLRAIVLDPAEGMTTAARRRPGVVAVRGTAQAMPFMDGAAGLVYFHLSIHYGDWRAAVGEAVRVCAKGGNVTVWTLGPRHHRSSNLARWFPSVPDLDELRFPDPAAIATELAAAGSAVTIVTEDEVVRRDVRSLSKAIRAGFVSTLQLLPEAELEAGLASMARTHPDPDEILEYQLRYDGVIARR